MSRFNHFILCRYYDKIMTEIVIESEVNYEYNNKKS